MTRAEEIQLARDLRYCGMTLAAIAEEFGVGRTTISRWLALEDGTQTPRGERLS